jgi:hypothetical protein
MRACRDSETSAPKTNSNAVAADQFHFIESLGLSNRGYDFLQHVGIAYHVIYELRVFVNRARCGCKDAVNEFVWKLYHRHF